jgi:single-stranded DNA-binding protein
MFTQSTFRSLARLPTTATRSFSTTPRASFARMQIIGRLGAEPELIDTSTGRQMVRYSLATQYGPADNRQTSWFRISAFMDEGARRNHLMSLQKG